jgi:hypothetical protein
LKQRDEYIEKYNSFHGDGAYEELYVRPPAYGSDYDTEEEEESSENDTDME